MRLVILVIAFVLHAVAADAQMADSFGGLAMDGLLSADGYRGLGQMRQSFGRVRIQQDIALLNLEIQSGFMHGYQNLSKENLQFNGLQNIEWDVIPYENGYYIELSDLSEADCIWSRSNPFSAAKVETPGGCRNKENVVKLYF